MRVKHRLGGRVPELIDACIEALRRTPKIHTVVYEKYRRALARRFPYAVFYESTEDTVTVYGISHTSRDPAKWRRRLSGGLSRDDA